MDNTAIIIKPLVTEKSNRQQTVANVYTFQVHPKASKTQIKQAVEKLYDVKVVDVRTMNRKGKPRRARYRMTRTSDWKRAVVQLDEASRIELF